ncbi:MAG TPA: hypothetical protein VGF17_03515 [Phytomonospora sp.]
MRPRAAGAAVFAHGFVDAVGGRVVASPWRGVAALIARHADVPIEDGTRRPAR